MGDYEFLTEPFDHQREIFNTTRELESYGLLWEQGTGKSKPFIDTAAWLWEQGKIDGVLVVAPPGVDLNWITDELPAHMPHRIRPAMKVGRYRTDKAGTKYHQREMDELVKHKGFAWLCISYNAFMTEKGKNFIWRWLRRRRCLYGLDEAHFIKSPGAKRTKSIIASGRYAPYRRIMTGTPISQGPFDIYAQVRFLDEAFWRERSMSTFAEFKTHYGVWFTRADCQAQLNYDPGFDKLIEYRNLGELKEFIALAGSRITKETAGLNLPPKLYSKRYFELTKEQRRVYDELKRELMVEIEAGRVLTAELAIVCLLRLQQIASGYVQMEPGDTSTIVKIGDRNPRLETLQEVCEPLGHKAIIWARFRRDIDDICEMLGDRAVRYDGSVSQDQAAEAKEAFQHGDAQFFVGNAAKGGTGLTLTAARTVIYYSNSFKLVDRLQSEDRAHRIGQEHPVNYVDLVALDTVDARIVSSLRSKFDIANQLTGDELKDWI